MTTSVFEHTFNAPSPLTAAENKLLNEKLDSVINQKLNEERSVAFSTSEAIPDPNPSSIDLSRFGLKNPDDIKTFLLTPAGETVKHEVAVEAATEKAIQDERLVELQENIMLHERRRALLFHWLLSEEEESKTAQQELISLQNEAAIKASSTEHQKTSSAQELRKTPEDSIRGYDKAIEDLIASEHALREQEALLRNERQLIETKYDAYENGLKDFDESVPELESKSIDDLENEIKDLQSQADRIADEMNQTAVEEELNDKVNQLNTIGLKVASINDIIAVKKQDKIYVDAEGSEVNADNKAYTFKDAAFVLNKGQKIQKVNEHEYCLLERGQSWTAMNDREKAEAKLNFQNKKNDIQIVKNVVNDVKKLEVERNETRIVANKAEQLTRSNQRSLMNHAKKYTNAQSHSLINLDIPQDSITNPLPKGTPEVRSEAPLNSSNKVVTGVHASPSIMQAKSSFLITELNDLANKNGKDYQPSWKDLFRIVNKIPDPAEKEEATKVVENEKKKQDPLELLKNPPVPHDVMATILKHMARWALNPYDEAVTSEPQPLVNR